MDKVVHRIDEKGTRAMIEAIEVNTTLTELYLRCAASTSQSKNGHSITKIEQNSKYY